jgi:hypothetical protein
LRASAPGASFGRSWLLDDASDDLDVRADAAGPAELPQLPRGALVVVDDLVDIVDVERAAPVDIAIASATCSSSVASCVSW